MTAMRHFVLGFLLLGLSVCSVRSQGLVGFWNNSPTAITNITTWNRAATTTKVALYYTLNTNVTSGYDAAFILCPNSTTNLFSAGLFNGRIRGIPDTPPGTPIAVVVRAWSPPYATWEAQDTVWLCDPQPRGVSDVLRVTAGGDINNPVPSLTSSGLKAFTIGPHLGPRLCPPLVTVFRETNTLKLRIDRNGSSLPGTHFRIYSSATLATNSWISRTGFYMPSSIPFPNPRTNVVWEDPISTNQLLFYRVQAARNP